MGKVLGLFCALIMLSCESFAQQPISNLRHKTISTEGDTITLDTLSIDPATFKISIDTTLFDVDYAQALLVWRTAPTADSITISYRVWPVNITQPYWHKPPDAFLTPDAPAKNPFTYHGNQTNNSAFTQSKLDKSGSISRGMLVGNNQNLGINSNMNLQLAGELSNKVKIKAVISDNNIPVQPDGNTQLIQDFDQVYIQLYHDNYSLIGGDYRISNPQSHFMAYDKRLRGGSVSVNTHHTAKVFNKVSASAALSRGKFSRNIIDGLEGNQGPYRLKGAENEVNIIILSGTEVVYIDGIKMERGQNNDYVIDYNSSEITFTAKQPITKDKRIIVEFQYSAQAYSRSLITFENNLHTEKLTLNLNAYIESDNKNKPLLQDLTDANKQLLSSIGNNIDQAIAPSERAVEYANDRVLYKKVIGPLGDSIYVYSTAPDSAFYQVTFNNVGLGNGNYIEIPSVANGRVFEHVAPINGIAQGNYAPVIVLITPKKQDMYTLGGTYKISQNTHAIFEGAITIADPNTFSSEGNNSNTGGGFLVGIKNQKYFSSDTLRSWKLNSQITYENRTDNFAEVQRYRSVEFDRNWNIRGVTLTGHQHVPTADFSLNKNQLGKLGYEFKSFLSGEAFQGFRHQLYSDLNNSSFTAQVNASAMTSGGTLGESTFYREKALLQKKYSPFNIGFRNDFEHNIQKAPNTDSLSLTSYSFHELEGFITNNDSTVNKFRVGYIYRVNDNVKANQLQRATIGKSIVGQYQLLQNPKAQFKLFSQYRELEVTDSTLYQGNPEKTLTNRLEYNLRLLKNVITWSSFYELGSGLAEEQSFIYVEVPAGTGVYTWNDYNGNGIAELDEFEVAQFQDQANYVRVLIQTNNFEKIYRTQFNQSLMITPARVWSNKNGIRKVASKFSNQLAYRIDRKTSDNTVENWINPFAGSVADSNIRTLASSFRNTVYLNRSNPTWSIDYTYQNASTKTLQSNGLYGTETNLHQWNFRYNLTRIYQINIETQQGYNQSGAELYSTRNYYITQQRIKPTLTYLQGSGVQIKFFYEQSLKKNTAELGGEQNENKSFGSELTVRKVGKGSVLVSGTYAQNKFQGDANTATAFQMLEGLQPGQNIVWQLTYQRTIAKYLQLNVQYNGRSSEDNPVVHTANVQVRAFF